MNSCWLLEERLTIDSMKVEVKRIDKELPLPKYETDGSVGFDLLAREAITILPGELKLIPNNIIVGTPKGYMFMLANRSSTPKKKGLMVANGVGIIDLDYCGPEDEVKTLVYNFTNTAVTIERGDRVSQGIFIRVDCAEWKEVDEVHPESRGGFGSTG